MKPIDLETLARPVLHGDRITLRPIVPEDGEAIFRSLSDEEAMRLTGTQQSFTVEEVKRHCASKANARNCMDYAIVVEGNLIGEVKTAIRSGPDTIGTVFARPGPFGDAGAAIERLLEAGASRRDLSLIFRGIAYEAVFGTLYALSDPGWKKGKLRRNFTRSF